MLVVVSMTVRLGNPKQDMPSSVVERLSSRYDELRKVDDSISRVLDNLWLLICGTLLMFPGR